MHTADKLRNYLDLLHTTELGAMRIKRNLELDTDDVVGWCKKQILSADAVITQNGKNWYVRVADYTITVNASSYTIITAHKVKRKPSSTVTRVYFVRHAQSDHSHKNDKTRPLTAEGKADSKIVLNFLKDREIDVFYSSPYKRSIDTIADAAAFYGKKIHTDKRLREREAGVNSNNQMMFAKRWANLDYHEDQGESIHMVQKRNMTALEEILEKNKGKNIVIGTHGTALSSILNFYNPAFGCKDFLRIIDWMPYVVELDFDGIHPFSIKEHCHIEKSFPKEHLS